MKIAKFALRGVAVLVSVALMAGMLCFFVTGTGSESAATAGAVTANINDRFDGVWVGRPEGTYMLFPDFSGWLEKTGRTMDELCRAMWDIGCAVNDGRPFHGASHLRINVALPKVRVEEAFDRMDKYIFGAK